MQKCRSLVFILSLSLWFLITILSYTCIFSYRSLKHINILMLHLHSNLIKYKLASMTCFQYDLRTIMYVPAFLSYQMINRVSA